MGIIIRFVFPLIAYFSVATVLIVSASYVYLRQTKRLDDDQLFRIVSILHGVDLEEIAKQGQVDEVDVPAEELSHEQQRQQIQVATLHLQGKQDDIKNKLDEFESQFRQLNVKTSRYQSYQKDVEQYLADRKKEALESGLVAVRGHWQDLPPKKQTKELLKKLDADGHTDQVILLLNGMPKKKRTDILKTLDSEEDLKLLYKIEKKMLAGHPEKGFIDDKLEELNVQKQDDK